MRRWLKRAAIGLAVVFLALAVYGTAVEPRLILDEVHHRAEIPNLGEDWSGQEIAVVADLQIGMWLQNTGMVEDAVERIVEADPAVALLGGDFLYGTGDTSDEEIATLLALLEPLTEAAIPTFAVLGNHDHAVGAADQLTRALERRGIDVLVNDAATVNGLYVVGLGSERFGLARPAEALAGVPEGAPRVVLMHNPASFPALPPDSAPLALAGHTHCGQIAIPGLPQWSWLDLTTEEEVVTDGFAPAGYGAPGNRLFVTCGIGFSAIPVRINAPPQVVFFELVPA